MRQFSLLHFLTLASLSTLAASFQCSPTFQRQSSHASKLQRAASLRDDADSSMDRRRMMSSLIGSSLAVLSAGTVVNALDMDAFVNSQLESDTKNCDPKKDPKCKPQLSADEALCFYGQSGTARGEACQRVDKAKRDAYLSKPQGKSLGGAYAM